MGVRLDDIAGQSLQPGCAPSSIMLHLASEEIGLTPLMDLGKLAGLASIIRSMPQSVTSAAQHRFVNFAEFYPYYLGEHRNRTCRRLHFLGTSLVFVLILAAAIFADWRLLLALPVAGYGFAWIGHFVFEKNRPATFSHPWYSLVGDLALFRDMLVGRIKF